MPKLYYKNEFRGELTEVQATRIKESMNQKPRPQNLTINGELLKTSQIEVFKDDMETAKIPDNVEFRDKRIKTEKEIESMRKWSVERKVEFNFTRNFSVRFLLRVGYTNYLGEGWDKNGWEWWWQEFERRYKSENEDKYLELCEVFAKYFETNLEHYWCSAKIYKQFLPEHTALRTNNLGIQGSGEYQTDQTRDKRKKEELKF
jgi:hypothetical protein